MILKKFSRNPKARKILLRQLLSNFVTRRTILTTTARAKRLKGIFDRVVTHLKKENFRAYYRSGLDRDTFTPMLGYAKQMRDRSGGYASYHRVLNRKGDNAPMAQLKFLVN